MFSFIKKLFGSPQRSWSARDALNYIHSNHTGDRFPTWKEVSVELHRNLKDRVLEAEVQALGARWNQKQTPVEVIRKLQAAELAEIIGMAGD